MRRYPFVTLLLAVLLCLPPLPLVRAQRTPRAATTAAPASGKFAPNTSAASASMVAARAAAERIVAERLREDLYVVASDTMGGRDTPSPGLDETAKFIAARLASLKIKPAGDNGTYFQRIELRSLKTDAEKTKAELSGRSLNYGEDFLVFSEIPGEAAGSLVYVGHGYRVKSKKIDAYEGLDVRGKILVASSERTPPAGVVRADLKGKAGEGEWDNAASYAKKNGALGLVYIPRNYERTWARLQLLRTRAQGSFQIVREQEEEGRVPILYPSAETVRAIFANEKLGGDEIMKSIRDNKPAASFSLSTEKRLSFTVSAHIKTAYTQNVVGILEGKNKKLKKEYVALGAHYDHVGVGLADKSGDTVYNGADDDGSGTVSILALAEAFARGPRPKRSILFVWHCGEEKGLWGSEYFTEHPTVPLQQVVAQLNIDMIGRSKKEGDTNPANRELTGPDEIYVIGSKEMSTELGALSERINDSYLRLKFNYLYDDPRDPNRFFFRSDHFNYAKKGIPIIFYFDGEHEDYHRPSDTPDKIDYVKMEKVARTVFATAWELANAPTRPVVDKPLAPERTVK